VDGHLQASKEYAKKNIAANGNGSSLTDDRLSFALQCCAELHRLPPTNNHLVSKLNQ